MLVRYRPDLLQDNTTHLMSDWGSSGRRFKSCQPDQEKRSLTCCFRRSGLSCASAASPQQQGQRHRSPGPLRLGFGEHELRTLEHTSTFR